MFPSAATTAVSGMNATQVAFRASAHNVANVETPDFQRQTVVNTTTPSGGVETAVARAATTGAAMDADVVGMLQAKNAFLANLAVFRASDRMAGTLVDIAT